MPGGCAWLGVACPGGYAWPGGMHAQDGHVWLGRCVHCWGVCVAGGMHDWGVCIARGHAFLGGVHGDQVHGRGVLGRGDMCVCGGGHA